MMTREQAIAVLLTTYPCRAEVVMEYVRESEQLWGTYYWSAVSSNHELVEDFRLYCSMVSQLV